MVLIGADVWRLDQARELVQLSQASLPSTHARQPDLAVLLARLQLYSGALNRPEALQEFK